MIINQEKNDVIKNEQRNIRINRIKINWAWLTFTLPQSVQHCLSSGFCLSAMHFESHSSSFAFLNVVDG